MDLNRVLSIFDLKDKKAAVYIATLELGSSTVTPIAKRAGVIRTTTYDLLEDLQIKGLVIYHEVNGRRYYQVADPRRLKQILVQQQKEVDSALPEILALYKPSKEKPVVRFYEGAEEIKKIYEELLSATEFLGFGNFGQIEKYFPEFPRYAKKQLKRSIKIRDIMQRTDDSQKYLKLYVPPKHQVRFLPDDVKIETDNIIFGDKVAMISFGETVHGLIIESKEIAATQKELHNKLWAVSSEM